MVWTVAVTWPHYERRVERTLTQHGFACYVPKYRTRKRSGLLFPRYVFAGPASEWQALRQIHGVSRLLRTGDRPAHVPEACVQALRAREDREGFVRLPRPPRFKVGQRVRITLGAFTGLIGIYRGKARHDRDRVGLVLGEVTLPADNLMAE